MATIRSEAFEDTGTARGIKAAAFVLILGSVALAADHLLFTAGHPDPAIVVPAAAIGGAATAVDGFALPESLRPTAADASDPTPTF